MASSVVGESILDQVVVALGEGRHRKGVGLNRDDISPLVGPIYDRVRQNCLKTHYWAFAEEMATPELDTARKPMFGFSAYYTLPTDFLSLSYVNGNNVYLEGWRGGWHLFGERTMAANFRPYVSYTRNFTDHFNFPSHFTDYLVHMLAASICISATGDKDLASFLYKQAAMSKHDDIQIDWRDQGDYDTLETGNVAVARRIVGDTGPLEEVRVDVEQTPIRSMTGDAQSQ